jgi:hypothetical protein
MVAASECGHEERAERNDRDRDEDGEPTTARFPLVTTVSGGCTPCTP